MSATTSSSKPSIDKALKTLNRAIAKISNLPAGSVPATSDDFKLFELALTVEILRPASWLAGIRWQCSTAPVLVLSPRPQELSNATKFTAPGMMAVALNVNVHYIHSPWRGARHEADLAVFDPSQAAQPHLEYQYVQHVFEAKYRKDVAKSVLRELAFVAKELPAVPAASTAKRVLLAVPTGPWKTTHVPAYWASAQANYGVSVIHVAFP